jgi:hypothetical protein
MHKLSEKLNISSGIFEIETDEYEKKHPIFTLNDELTK